MTRSSQRTWTHAAERVRRDAAHDRAGRVEGCGLLREIGRRRRAAARRGEQRDGEETSHGILSRYFASATSDNAQMRDSAAFDSGESTSICMKASLPRCFREHDSEAMLIPSSAMIFVTSE